MFDITPTWSFTPNDDPFRFDHAAAGDADLPALEAGTLGGTTLVDATGFLWMLAGSPLAPQARPDGGHTEPVLLFDEADAIFGRRGEIDESEDRWAAAGEGHAGCDPAVPGCDDIA